MTTAEAKRSQEKRQIAIDTPGDTNLLFIAMHGNETLGRMFHFELELMKEGSPLEDFKDILGQNVTIRVDKYNEETRYINGYISRFMFTGAEDDDDTKKKLYMYRATMVPWTWFLTRSSDCRIFQEKTVPQIIQQIFKDRGFTDFKLDLHTHRTWDYCVQYRETDFNFISRLMEQEGIYYYYEHEDGKHTMVLVDSSDGHKPAPKYDELSAKPTVATDKRDDFIWEWTFGSEITPTKYALTDYNFEQPKTNLFKSDKVQHEHDPGPYEIFDFPGGYTVGDDGKNYVSTRMKEVEAQYAVGHATSGARGIYPGCTFKLTDHPQFTNKEYLITSLSYQARGDTMGAELGRGGGGGSSFVCQITCIPKGTQFRSPRVTPKPLVQGPQTAVVVGPSGEEIYTDKYGRVKVSFFWDRESKKDEKSSCWIRVAQNWAGKQWGIIFNPRIGQEVIVDFLEGDPDRPIITGRVYNGDQMPPYELPANQTQSGVKTRSSKEGASANFNEIRFEDKKGEEQLFIHAEKNQDIEVENNETHWVGHDRSKTIDHDESTRVKNNRTETVDNDETISIKGNRTETVEKDETITVNSNRTETVQKDETITINGNRTETVAKSETVSISKDRTSSINENEKATVGKDRDTSIGGNDTLTVGKALSITAADSITLTTGSASITMKKDGTITIKGNDITIDGSGKITCKASSDVILKGSSVKQN